MGLLTWRQTKKTRKDVKKLSRQIGEAVARPLAPTPDAAARAAQLSRRSNELIAELKAHGFAFKMNRPWDREALDALNAAGKLVVVDGATIREAAQRVAAARDAAAAM